MADIGYEGQYMPMVVPSGSLNELQKLAGPPPALGKKWFMVNLSTGECKWYQSQRRSSGGYRQKRSYGYGRRMY